MNVRLDPAAREDIVYAVEWYAQRDRKAARRFLAAVDAEMIEQIVEVFHVGGKIEAGLQIEIRRRLTEAAQIKPQHTIETGEVRLAGAPEFG